MAAVTFPDPAANNPATGAPYGDGWYNPANGVTYKFENNVWSAITEPNTSLDARYVEVAGDNMTGDLTLSADKIRLYAANGNAEFAGAVNALRLGAEDAASKGALSIANVDTGLQTCVVTGDGRLRIGSSAGSDPKIKLEPDGSAEFAGNITAGNVSFNLEPDNPANYTTTTDSEGNETQVYNGPTLDVKDRLTRTATALTALKAAASDSSTTLAGLKSAFVTALADF